ncbi:MAG: molybdate ABC transporter substrate-binding protein [Acidobacteriota bacterium]
MWKRREVEDRRRCCWAVRSLLWIICLTQTACLPTSRDPVGGGSLTVAAASDLSDVLSEARNRFERQTASKVILSFGSTGLLAKQIEQGAPFDVFLAAAASFVDNLNRQGLVVEGSVQTFARGRLVIWRSDQARVGVERILDLENPAVQRVALANPEHAPYGKAGRQALENSGLWSRIQHKIVFGENVRQALQFAETGNADAALVALALTRRAGGRFVLVPEELHEPIVQTLCILRRTSNAVLARSFVQFLTTSDGRELLSQYGFFPLSGKDSQSRPSSSSQ